MSGWFLAAACMYVGGPASFLILCDAVMADLQEGIPILHAVFVGSYPHHQPSQQLVRECGILVLKPMTQIMSVSTWRK
jgi:hypothetical protein